MRALALILMMAAAGPAAAADRVGCLPASVRSALSQIQERFGRIQILSTHRPGARVAGTGRTSLHASCRAVDFRPSPGRYGAVVRWLEQNFDGGIGTYSGGFHHIHIDNGPSVRFHKHQWPRMARKRRP